MPKINNTGFLERVLVRLEFIRSEKGTVCMKPSDGSDRCLFHSSETSFWLSLPASVSVDADFMTTLPLLSTVKLLKY